MIQDDGTSTTIVTHSCEPVGAYYCLLTKVVEAQQWTNRAWHLHIFIRDEFPTPMQGEKATFLLSTFRWDQDTPWHFTGPWWPKTEVTKRGFRSSTRLGGRNWWTRPPHVLVSAWNLVHCRKIAVRRANGAKHCSSLDLGTYGFFKHELWSKIWHS